MRSPLNLLGSSLDMVKGQWKDASGGIGASSDSFYEYLLKAYILFGQASLFFTATDSQDKSATSTTLRPVVECQPHEPSRVQELFTHRWTESGYLDGFRSTKGS